MEKAKILERLEKERRKKHSELIKYFQNNKWRSYVYRYGIVPYERIKNKIKEIEKIESAISLIEKY